MIETSLNGLVNKKIKIFFSHEVNACYVLLGIDSEYNMLKVSPVNCYSGKQEMNAPVQWYNLSKILYIEEV